MKMKHASSAYLPELEKGSDVEVSEALNAVEGHPIDCVNWPEFPYAPKVTFHLAHSDKVLAVLFKVTEDHVRGTALEANGPVWEDSCVEIFISDPAGEGYYNFETSCIGTRLAARRRSRADAVHFTPEQMEQIRTFGSLPHEMTDIEGEGLCWWRAVLIPFSLIGADTPPASLRANFYKCGDRCRKPHFLSWSEITLPQPDFHCPDFFGEITLPR